jgi:hypothetical protein
MGQIANGMAKGGKAYFLEMQSRYDGSDRERHGKGREGIHSEDTAGTVVQITNGIAKR